MFARKLLQDQLHEVEELKERGLLTSADASKQLDRKQRGLTWINLLQGWGIVSKQICSIFFADQRMNGWLWRTRLSVDCT